MGVIHRGIPRKLALDLKDKFYLSRFIETGTFMGATAEWACQNFMQVYTIDLSDHNTAQVMLRIGWYPNVQMRIGDSSKVLSNILRDCKSPALIWLDAHWSPDLGYDKPEVVCPVLAEIDQIQRDGRNHVILVDDARLFGSTDGFPSRSTVITALGYKNRQVSEKEDVFVSIPASN